MTSRHLQSPTWVHLLWVVLVGVGYSNVGAAEEPVVTEIYKSDFGKGVDAERWTHHETLEVGGATILVPGWNAKFNKGNLPKHEYVRVRVELNILGTFDGNDSKEGPDNWAMLAEDGALLYLTNFRNAPAADKRGPAIGIGQAFPDEFPAGMHPSGTGAAKMIRDAGALESVYRVEVIFPHRDTELVIHFQEGMRKHGDPRTENWGIRSMEVELLSSHLERTDKQLAALWEKLIGEDPTAANDAVRGFIASGEKGVEFVRKEGAARAKAEDEAEAKVLEAFEEEVGELIQLVDSEVFRVRQAAMEDLTKLPTDALPLLVAELDKKHKPEIALAIKGALRVIRKRPQRDPKNWQRAAVRSRVARVLRIHDTIATGRTITASDAEANTAFASLDDGFVPESLTPHAIPRFDMWAAKGGEEGWVQYDFPKPKTFDFAQVYWFENVEWNKGAKLPKSWRLSYLDGKEWKLLRPKGKYSVSLGKFDRVEFEPVETTSIRLTAKSSTNRVAILEFRVGEKED